MYLTYSEYQALGGGLPEQEFNNLELKAETLINWYTFNRLTKDRTYGDNVKKCVYLLIDILQKQEQAQSLGADQNGNTAACISSQSNDGVSVSFNTLSAEQALQASKSEIEQYIYYCLNNARNTKGRKLLYRGVYPDDE